MVFRKKNLLPTDCGTIHRPLPTPPGLEPSPPQGHLPHLPPHQQHQHRLPVSLLHHRLTVVLLLSVLSMWPLDRHLCGFLCHLETSALPPLRSPQHPSQGVHCPAQWHEPCGEGTKSTAGIRSHSYSHSCQTSQLCPERRGEEQGWTPGSAGSFHRGCFILPKCPWSIIAMSPSFWGRDSGWLHRTHTQFLMHWFVHLIGVLQSFPEDVNFLYITYLCLFASFFLCFWDRVSPYSPRWPKYQGPAAFQDLGLQKRATTTSTPFFPIDI
jgi:hypothetical protein